MRLTSVSDDARGLGLGRVSGDEQVQNRADRSTNFEPENRSSLLSSVIEPGNNRLRHGCSGCMLEIRHD